MQIGLNNLHIAPVTEAENGTVTYGTPVKLAKAIKADISVQTASASLYADDALDLLIKEFISGTISLNVADLEPDAIKQLFGVEQDEDDVLYFGNENMTTPASFAVGFCAKKSGGKNRYTWLYKVQFTTPPAESFQTKGDNITILTPTIEGTIFRALDTGRWKADFVGASTETPAASWFTTVRAFKAA